MPVRDDASVGGGPGTRTCVGCRVEGSKSALTRLVRRPQGGAVIDASGHATGRGAYVHAEATCIESARKKRSLDRALRTTIQPEMWLELGSRVDSSHSP
jgi:hypothetical protein